VTSGKLVVGASGALPDSAVTITVERCNSPSGTGLAQVTSLSITGTGQFDINNNHVLINYVGGPDPSHPSPL